MLSEKIEIPSVSVLDQYRDIVNEFSALSQSLAYHAVGWSYYLEWAWIFGQVTPATFSDKTVLDAGAGLGLSQWYLAEHGARVFSVDRTSRACLPVYLHKRYEISGVREHDLLSPSRALNPFDRSAPAREKARNARRSLRGELFAHLPAGRAPGQIKIYNQDLAHLVDIPDETIDLVVSVSSLEHNLPQDLRRIRHELMRVLKPGGVLVATLTAAKEKDWLHTNSHSQCYTAESLKELFDLPADTPSNHDEFDTLMQQTRECKELRDGLPFHYHFSANNGMPWGRWNPLYLPVGVVKRKGTDREA